MASSNYRPDLRVVGDSAPGSERRDQPASGDRADAGRTLAAPLTDLHARLAALQRYTAKPRTPMGAGGSADAVYAAEMELAELRLEVREQSLRAEALVLELHQTTLALSEARAELERVHHLLQEAEARNSRWEAEVEGMRMALAERREHEQAAVRRADELQHQIGELTAAQIEFLKARPPAAPPPAATAAAPPPAPAKSAEPAPAPKKAATFRGRPIE